MLRALLTLIRQWLSRGSEPLPLPSGEVTAATKAKGDGERGATLPAATTMSDVGRLVCLRVKAARIQVGLTQEEIAERLNLTVEVYRKLEHGEMLPEIETLEKLVVVLEVMADALVGIKLLH